MTSNSKVKIPHGQKINIADEMLRLPGFKKQYLSGWKAEKASGMARKGATWERAHPDPKGIDKINPGSQTDMLTVRAMPNASHNIFNPDKNILGIHKLRRGRLREVYRQIEKEAALSNPITWKPKYKTVSDVDVENEDRVLQPKIDGAHAIFHLHHDGKNDIYSPRVSKRTGGAIEHSGRLPHLRDLAVPSELSDTVLRGELYGRADGSPLPAETVSGILNSSVSKSLEKQKEAGPLRPYIYDIVKFNGKDVSKEPYKTKFNLLKLIESKIPELKVADTAFTSAQKSRLLDAIKAKKYPDTHEGVVEWSLGKPGQPPSKLKFRDNHDVYIRDIYPAVSKSGEVKDEAGGFRFSWTPKGKIVGNVGTGFTQEKRVDMLQNPENYIGYVARVKSPQKFSSGALRAPAFYSMDVEKNMGKEAEYRLNKKISDYVKGAVL